MKAISVLFRRLRYALLNLLFYYPSKVIPKDYSLWLFGSPKNRFSDNSKYIYLWTVLNCRDVKAIWITGSRETYRQIKSQELPVQMRWSAKGLFYSLRAGVHVFCMYSNDINVSASGGCIKVNLWHGIGPKTLEYDAVSGERSFILRGRRNPLIRMAFLERFQPPQVFGSTTEVITKNYAKGFRIPESLFAELGTPRLDGLADSRLAELAREFDDSADFQQALSTGRKVVVYMPTWRDTGEPFFNRAFPDASRLRSSLIQTGAVLYLKAHLNTSDPHMDNLVDGDWIRSWPENLDFYSVISQVSCVITDYSTIHYDRMLVSDHGNVIYDFDNEEYSKHRELFVPFEDAIAGLRAKTFDELCACISSGRIFERYDDPERRDRIIDLFWGRAVPPASGRYVEHVKSKVNERLLSQRKAPLFQYRAPGELEPKQSLPKD